MYFDGHDVGEYCLPSPGLCCQAQAGSLLLVTILRRGREGRVVVVDGSAGKGSRMRSRRRVIFIDNVANRLQGVQ